MKKFKNIKTGNVLHVTNEMAIKLCTQSPQYEEIPATAAEDEDDEDTAST